LYLDERLPAAVRTSKIVSKREGELRMQQAITLQHNGLTLRGMEHVPDTASTENRVAAVILLHSFTASKVESHRMYVKLSRALEALGIASFRYDFSGSGESDGDFEEMTLSSELGEAHAILGQVQADKRIDPERISLLGLSMGGLVASLLAGDCPNDINKLALLAPAGNLGQIVQAVAEQVGINEEMRVFDHGGNLIGRPFADELADLDAFERAKTFGGSVLLIHGTEDMTVPYVVSERYQQVSYAGHSTLHPIEGAGHTFDKHTWEQEVIDTVLDFLK
jgi:uncharacterized protein